MRQEPKIAILGCGPAGMFAAHAAYEMGYKVNIFSIPRRSEMHGCQYLHSPIPGLPEKPAGIEYTLVGGSAEDYRRKVYGNVPASVAPDKVSPEDAAKEGWETAYDIRAAYYEAYSRYERFLIRTNMPRMDAGAVRDFPYDEYAAVFSTIPAPNICYNSHNFYWETVWAIGDAPERGIEAPDVGVKPGHVICNAAIDVPWYRASNLFGYRTVEWPYRDHHGHPNAIPGAAQVVKPLCHTCTCYDNVPNFYRLGRYGHWHKGELSHMAYWLTKSFLARN